MFTGRINRWLYPGYLLRETPANWGYRVDGSTAGQAPWFSPDNPQGNSFKYVPVSIAERIEQGEFRVGTLRSFKNVERRRSDAREGEHTVSSGRITSADLDNNPRLRFRLAELGIVVGQGNDITLDGNRFISVVQDMHCICFQGNNDTPDDLNEPQAIFKIIDLIELAWRISAAIGYLNSFAIGEVAYRDRDTAFPAFQAELPSPFLKPKAFAWENEKRIVWRSDPNAGDLEPFLVKISTRNLLERVR